LGDLTLITGKNEKLLFKEVLKSILRNKSYVILLYLFIMLTSFMYFFVQFSIDKNMEKLQSIMQSGAALSDTQNELLVALQSNASLAWTFLVCFLVMSAFVLYLFYKYYFSQHQKEFGVFKALGFTDFSIVKAYVLCTFLLSVTATLAGMLTGGAFSSVLLNAYTASYGITDLQKGIHTISIFYGVFLVILILCIVTILLCKAFCMKDTALLINDADTKKENLIVRFMADKISSVMPENKRFPVRIALRKPVTLILSIIAVGVSASLFIMSVSLYLSSNKVYQSQTEGHNYSYNIKLDEVHQNVSGENQNALLYLETSASLYAENGNELVSQQIIGLSDAKNLLMLYSKNGEMLSLPEDNKILIGAALHEVYGIKKGDAVTITISGKTYLVAVAGIAVNAETNCIYMSREQLAQWLGIPQTSYNGILIDDVNSEVSGKIITGEERLHALEKEVVSNRMSAIINQLLGCVAGCILIYLVLLLSFNDNTKEMLILDLLGYTPKEINKMHISVYRPIMSVAFLLMIFPSIAICKEIHRSLSIQTGDYIPFQTNVLIVLGIFIVIQIIYVVVETVFTAKIKKIVKSEAITEYLQ
jgi:putative ABC transport system permease protein